MPGIFISYRRDDSAYIASAINDRFQQRFGDANVFFDIDTIPLGVDFRDHIGGAVGGCDVLLVVIGDQWVHAKDKEGALRLPQPTDYVRVEIESALQRNVPVVPVLVGNAMMPTEAELPESIRALAFRNAAEVRAGRDLSDHLERLVSDVGKVAGITPHALSSGGNTQPADASKASIPASTPTASPTQTASTTPSKSRTPMAVAGLLILIAVGVGIAFATGMFNASPKHFGSKTATNTDGTTKDQTASTLPTKAVKGEGDGRVDQNQLIDTAGEVVNAASNLSNGTVITKDSKAATEPSKTDASSPDTTMKGETKTGQITLGKTGVANVGKTAEPNKAGPTGEPKGVDRADAKATAVAVLNACQKKDYPALLAFLSRDSSDYNRLKIASGYTKSHPGFNDVFTGWRGDAIKTWTGQVEEPRYDKPKPGRTGIQAMVRFQQKSLTPVIVVALELKDGRWEFVDFESPPEALYKRMSTEQPK